MFSKNKIYKSIENYSDNIKKLKEEIKNADAIVIGAGAGLSTAAGYTYNGDRFDKYFSDFKEKYGIQDMYSGGFYPYPNMETFWGFWARNIYVNRYDQPESEVYKAIRDNDIYTISFKKQDDPETWFMIQCIKQGESSEGPQKIVIGEILNVWIR